MPCEPGLSELQPAWLTWPAVESQGPRACVCVFLHTHALQRSPRHLSVQDPVLEAMNTGWSGEGLGSGPLGEGLSLGAEGQWYPHCVPRRKQVPRQGPFPGSGTYSPA